VAPRPARYGAVGIAVGVVLGLVLAFVREALDPRVRSVAELRRRLRLPLLGRVPAPQRRRLLRRRTGLVMVDAPYSADAEAYRILRANFDFFNVEHGARTIMVTSALEREGKSTTVANLAVAFARAGRRTVLVDLDLRRPALLRRFRLGAGPGVTDVALGRASLADALASVAVTSESNGAATLRVLGAGAIPPDIGEFVASGALVKLLRELRRDADVVLVDAPPLVRVGDAMALGARVDAVLVVARVNRAPRALVGELRRLLDACPAAKLGLVVTGADLDEDDVGLALELGGVPAQSATAVW
jgi:capsular exopolysaccharide synthesis family protein